MPPTEPTDPGPAPFDDEPMPEPMTEQHAAVTPELAADPPRPGEFGGGYAHERPANSAGVGSDFGKRSTTQDQAGQHPAPTPPTGGIVNPPDVLESGWPIQHQVNNVGFIVDIRSPTPRPNLARVIFDCTTTEARPAAEPAGADPSPWAEEPCVSCGGPVRAIPSRPRYCLACGSGQRPVKPAAVAL